MNLTINTQLQKLSIVLIAFFVLLLLILTLSYPLELEFREGTNWLHALILNKKVNIFKSNELAYINMNHGPMDSILKSFLLTILPLTPPTIVTRIFVILFPIEIFVLTFLLLKNHRKSLSRILIYSLLSYFPYLAISSLILVGRSDQTALFFAYIATYLILDTTLNKNNFWINLLIGISTSIMILTNWRYIILLPFFIFINYLKNGIEVFKSLKQSFVGLIIPPILIFKTYYDWDLNLYYKHYIGFFLGISGWQSNIAQLNENQDPQKLWHFILTFISSGNIHAAAFIFDVFCLIVFAILTISWNKAIFKLQYKLSILALNILCFLCDTSYIFNYSGGSLNYFFPFFVLVWALIIIYHNEIEKKYNIINIKFKYTLTYFFYIFIFLVLLNRYKFFYDNYNEAWVFKRQIDSIESIEHIYTESVYFQIKDSTPKIDMGDTVSAVEKSNYYGPEFSKIFKANLIQLETFNPTYILSSRVSSPELKLLLNKNYVINSCAPPKNEPCLYKIK